MEFRPVNDRPRLTGQSKYTNFSRFLLGLYDMIGIVWLRRRTRIPDISEDTLDVARLTDYAVFASDATGVAAHALKSRPNSNERASNPNDNSEPKRQVAKPMIHVACVAIPIGERREIRRQSRDISHTRKNGN